ncbi:hypothetical protein SCP_0504240 [Sparassis crispa]|uniref:Uncharacterized protein n=1 Tax=Sparassis crispa TaxID=139825 RepID=A0A401GME8_9APHY|nr:hypothetical protein SCP_0504240 [Sparassis crispa]GBE83376.1 hypothetical protein SCP_0504240 [Sparassis crispa]
MQSTEVFGILPIPDDVRTNSGMQEYQPSLDRKQEHAFLALKQGTRKAVLPVHSVAEYQLFSKLMREDPIFNRPDTEPSWAQAVKIWNRIAESEKEISYKLIEHLKVYYTTWKSNMNVKYTLAQTKEHRMALNNTLRDPLRSQHAPPAPERSQRFHDIVSGLQSLQETGSDSAISTMPSDHSLVVLDTRVQIPPVSSEMPLGLQNTIMAPANQMYALAHKRAVDATAVEPPTKKP